MHSNEGLRAVWSQWKAAAVPGWIRGRGVPALVALLMVGSTAPAAGQFSAQPVILELTTGAQTAHGSFVVRNQAEHELQLRVHAADFDQSEAGEHTFLEPGSHPRSCAGRLHVAQDHLVLEPGGQGEVQVRMAPGESTCWSLVFVESVSRGRGGMQITQRIGVKLYGFASGVVPEGEIRAVETGSSTVGEDWVEIAFANTGEGPVRPDGEVEVRTDRGEIVGVLRVPPFSVLPGRVRTTRIPLDVDLEPGSYLAVPILDFGGEYLAGGQAVFEVGSP